MARSPKTPTDKSVESLKHDGAKRLNNPTAELASLFEQQEELDGTGPVSMSIPRDRPLAAGETRERNTDRDPQILWSNAKVRLTQAQLKALAAGEAIDLSEAQLTWKGKDQQDWSDLVVNAPPIYVQEKVHPKAIIANLKRQTKARRDEAAPDLFADFNGLPDVEAATEFYQHAKHWQNRMILGDSLQVMASLAEREALRAKVQCIYFDPPYGIKFNSNWQVSTLSRDVKDGKATDVSREPEQVKAFRDTWKHGIHSYLSYLRDRLSVARELLTESGSIFVQIGDENVHRVRALMDEVFGEENSISQIAFRTTTGRANSNLPSASNYILWYSQNSGSLKFRPLFQDKSAGASTDQVYSLVRNQSGQNRRLTPEERSGQKSIIATDKVFRPDNITSSRPAGAGDVRQFEHNGITYKPGKGTFKSDRPGLERLSKADRLWPTSGGTVQYVRFFEDFPVIPFSNMWIDTGTGSFTEDKLYVVQTGAKVIERCILMTTDPGDLVLDPTCGSGTTAAVAEQWGRRWITIDTSRVALALARTRLMSARYPYYLLADSADGRAKEQQVSGKILPDVRPTGDVRQGFVYQRAPHIMLQHIANNAQIDDIWEKWQATLEPIRGCLNDAAGTSWEEWQVPRAADPDLADTIVRIAPADLGPLIHDVPTVSQRWLSENRMRFADVLDYWWTARIARQTEIDASIAKAADVELLYDRPYEDKGKVRVAGPFTVESLSPHRVVTSRDDTLGDELKAVEGRLQRGPLNTPDVDFAEMVLDNLRKSGVHQQAKSDTIHFSSLDPWPGSYVAAVGTYLDGAGVERRAGVLIGPEFGSLTRSQITAAAREASEARLDALVACAFNFDAQATDLNRLGPLAILKARMNPDLHMAEDLKNTGKGNLFVVFGEPDVEILDAPGGEIRVKVHGVDVFDPTTGEIRSDGTDGIAVWFIDTDYDEESFFVRHAYFLGAAKSGDSDPYKSLKTALKSEIDADAWATLYSDVSRPFPRPSTGRIAVKVINHFGDEVLKVFGV